MNVLPIEIPIVLCEMNDCHKETRDCRTETNDCPKEIRVCLKINKRTSYRNALSPLGLAFNVSAMSSGGLRGIIYQTTQSLQAGQGA